MYKEQVLNPLKIKLFVLLLLIVQQNQIFKKSLMNKDVLIRSHKDHHIGINIVVYRNSIPIFLHAVSFFSTLLLEITLLLMTGYYYTVYIYYIYTGKLYVVVLFL